MSVLVRQSLFLLALACAAGCGKSGGGGGAFSTAPASLASTTFRTAAPLAQGRVFHTSVLLPSGKVLVIGGQTSATTVTGTCELVDPATGTTSPAPSLLGARMNHAAVLLPTQKVLVLGGQSDVAGAQALDTTEVFDPKTNAWTAGPTLGEARSAPAVAAFRENGVNKLLVAGGARAQKAPGAGVQLVSSRTADVVNVDALQVTPTTSLLAEPRHSASAVTVGGRVLVQGGYTELAGGSRVAATEVYEIATGLFLPAPNVVARAESSVIAVGSDTYAIGGTDGTIALASAEKFDGRTWSVIPAQLVTARYGHTIALTSSQLLATGGLSLAPLASSTTAAVPSGSTAAVSSGSKAAKGKTASTATPGQPVALATSEFLALSGTPAAAPRLNVARAHHTVTPLPNGQLVVIGGSDQGTVLASVEVLVAVSPPTTGAGTAPITSAAATPVAVGSGSNPGPGGTTVAGAAPTVLVIDPGHASVGQLVEVKGLGFDATPAKNVVKFNGITTPVLRVVKNPDHDRIQVVVPAGAKSGPVTVEVAGRASAGLSFTIQ